MAKSLQRRKPGYTKAGEVRIVSLNAKQLVPLLEKAGTKKLRAKIQLRLNKLGYQAPALEVADTPAE